VSTTPPNCSGTIRSSSGSGLRDEFEIRERFAALHGKLALISRTAETALELMQNRRALRVEWAIVGLIVFEIVLTLVQWGLALAAA
jgi:uncharacterized Rmd1/YagE family protein